MSLIGFSILVNGCAKGWAKVSRGLRQGDPFSPFLFSVVVDVLSMFLVRVEEHGILEGLSMGWSKIRVCHS